MNCTKILKAPSSNIKTVKPILLSRTKDPLLASSSAQHYTLPSGSIFIVRSPPSTLPPTMPYPPQQSTSNLPGSSSILNPTSTFFHLNPTSPFLFTNDSQHLLPSTRSTPIARSILTSEDLASLHSLRISAPSYWTRSKLAIKFGIPQNVVGRLGWGEGKEAQAAEKSRKLVVDREQDRKEGNWGWKKTVAREERRRRRAMW